MTFSEWMAIGTGGQPLSCEVAFEGGKKVGRDEAEPKIESMQKRMMNLKETLEKMNDLDISGNARDELLKLLVDLPKDKFVNIQKVKEIFQTMEVGLNKLSGEGLITKGK